MPACDQLIILLSRSQGLANWPSTNENLGLDSKLFSSCLDYASAIILTSRAFLEDIKVESLRFQKFTTWLRIALENLIPTENVRTASVEEPSKVETNEVCDFINDMLITSSLFGYFDCRKSKLSEADILGFVEGDEHKKFAFELLIETLMPLCEHACTKPADKMRNSVSIVQFLYLTRPSNSFDENDVQMRLVGTVVDAAQSDLCILIAMKLDSKREGNFQISYINGKLYC